MKKEDDFGYFHVCTDGTVLPWMFKDNQDFILGCNRVGICRLLTGVVVLDFILMDNHVHFLLYSNKKGCRKFIDKYKLLTGKWISHKYGIQKFLKRLPVSIIPLRNEEDILETAAYIDRNSVMAGFKGLPSEYPWGSCRLMFRKEEETDFKTMSDFSENELRDLLKSRVRFPDNWSFNCEGMINPQCFTDINRAESLFKTPVRYLFFLTKKLEGKINQTLAQGSRSFISDKDLREIAIGLAYKEFGSVNIRFLDVNSRIRLAHELRKDFLASHKQISRILHLEVEILKELL